MQKLIEHLVTAFITLGVIAMALFVVRLGVDIWREVVMLGGFC